MQTIVDNLLSIEQAVLNFRSLIENAIRETGEDGKQAIIRSQRPIMNIHDAVKSALISKGVNPELIFPNLYHTKPELKLAGGLKQKDQDICVVPNDREVEEEIMSGGLLSGAYDKFGIRYTEETLTINVRSQISSVQKNFDTLYERTISEAQNLHDRCPKMVLGEVYMLAVPEYEDASFKEKSCTFKKIKTKVVEKYIKSFKAITGREDITRNFYQYEATCLLIVDFSKDIPKVYHKTSELISDGLLPDSTSLTYEGLDWDHFSDKILQIYSERFSIDKLR